jgi:hypothetical protein
MARHLSWCLAIYKKGDLMNDKQMHQFIGYAVVLIIAYYILQAIVPFLIWGVFGVVVWRIYLETKK